MPRAAASLLQWSLYNFRIRRQRYQHKTHSNDRWYPVSQIQIHYFNQIFTTKDANQYTLSTKILMTETHNATSRLVKNTVSTYLVLIKYTEIYINHNQNQLSFFLQESTYCHYNNSTVTTVVVLLLQQQYCYYSSSAVTTVLLPAILIVQYYYSKLQSQLPQFSSMSSVIAATGLCGVLGSKCFFGEAQEYH